jgi:addiction module RelE/StbE family toxin
MKLRVTRRARRHLDAIAEYIAERNPNAARRVGERIREVAGLLSEFPLMGRAGTLAGTREMGVPGLPYVIVYRIDVDAVTILGVYHGAQLRPGQERPRDRWR